MDSILRIIIIMYECTLIQKRDSHTFVWKSLDTTLNLNIYNSRFMGIYFIVYCFQKQLLNRQRPQEYNPQSMSLMHTSILG